MKLPVVSWLVSLPASLLYCIVATGLHQNSGAADGAPAVAAALSTPLAAVSIALWVLADARRRRRSLYYDFGSFVFFAWPLLVPIYLFSTRGWRGFTPIGWFLLLYLGAALISVIPWLLTSSQ